MNSYTLHFLLNVMEGIEIEKIHKLFGNIFPSFLVFYL